jgi:fused signal recognition particle receptor
VSEEESREAREAWAELFGLETPPSGEAPKKRRGLFSRLKQNLSTPRQAISPHIAGIFEGKLVDEESWEDLEEALMMADCGIEATTRLVDRLREESEDGKIVGGAQLGERFTELVSEEMAPEPATISLESKPTVIMMVGVNGSGKTTTVGKLSHRLSDLGLEVVVGAADTFRAAAIDQLAVWTDRAGVQLVRQAPGADPGAVAYDAVVAAKSRDADVVIVDTAGRLQTQKNLMRELEKVAGVLDKALDGAPHHVLLTLDATTGQNGLSQARLFGEAVDVDGVVLTKIDGTARGGIAVAIRSELGIPVKLVGSGETLEDLQPFDGQAFAEAIFSADDA